MAKLKIKMSRHRLNNLKINSFFRRENLDAEKKGRLRQILSLEELKRVFRM